MKISNSSRLGQGILRHPFFTATMGKRMTEEEAATAPSHSPEPTPDKKRKQDSIPDDEKLCIDVSAPEPPSKKARRAERKRSSNPKTIQSAIVSDAARVIAEKYASKSSRTGTTTITAGQDASKSAATVTRSDHGIWIGNLPFSATKDSLKQFLKEEGKIESREIVRLHMPAPTDKVMSTKASNKGFAYVDFASEEGLGKAMGLTEFMMGGRRVLVKNAKSFEGRPEKKEGGDGGKGVGGVVKKEPAKRIFVGNLGFDVTKEDLEELFGVAGEVEDVHMATFQDSGKCKGFAWIRFVEVEAAEAAVRGFVYVKAEGEDSDDEESGDEEEDQADAGNKKQRKTKPRRHKKHINQLHGRPLRCEFAEDPQTRYKKRYGKDAVNPAPGRDRRAPPAHDAHAPLDPAAAATVIEGNNPSAGPEDLSSLISAAAAARSTKGPTPHAQKMDKEQRRDERRKRHDARTVAPGAALAGAQRATGAIVEGQGRKVVFD
ncbi:hypothetical protein B0A55_00233 [Friedmanniomyces simplex]|uniref:RRM domain-containing protein n=1 Tax=Friedmanniomyces simplex TaxID=329884 RepID=A0A4U0Y0N1_9PEZI|nr:hypothetical protein B0A55_00233 [Friedmanniomyces simplex]